MALSADKAKTAFLMLGKKAPPAEGDTEGSDDSLGADGLAAAMSDFLAAIKSEDPDGMAEAFRHALDLADSPEEPPDEE